MRKPKNYKSILDYNTIHAILLVHAYFNDVEKTALWFQTDNPNFGGLSPEWFVRIGRSSKLNELVKKATLGNDFDLSNNEI